MSDTVNCAIAVHFENRQDALEASCSGYIMFASYIERLAIMRITMWGHRPIYFCAVVLTCVIAIALSCHGEMTIDHEIFKHDSRGILHVDDLIFAVKHYDGNWQVTKQQAMKVAEGYPTERDRGWQTKGHIPILKQQATLALDEWFETHSPTSVHVNYNVQSSRPLPTRSLCLEIALPIEKMAGKSVVVNGKPYVLPVIHKESALLREKHVQHLELPASTGWVTLDGDMDVLVQDNRQWASQTYSVRIKFSTSSGQIERAALDFRLGFRAYRCVPIDISGVANRGFHDETAGDHKGGWTDQGPENDLACMTSGRLKFEGVAFDVLDEALHPDKSCVVFQAGKMSPVTLAVPWQPTWANLYLLHASAWTPVGKVPVGQIQVQYADGTSRVIDVLSNQDVGNWWGPTSFDNGTVGWSSQNKIRRVGLYVSRFELDAKPLRSIHFKSDSKASWMVVAVSGSPDHIALPSNIPYVATQLDRQWAAYELKLDIQPDSVFDFSELAANDKPAGQYGHLTVSDHGHFVFSDKPKTRVRFWGVNTCLSANFPDHDLADRIAERLARSGYNTLRIHHYDRDLILKDGPSYVFDPRQLDKLDYFFAALKKRGIYINIDLYSIRQFSQKEIPDLGRSIQQDIKGLIPVSDAAFDAWAHFAKNLLIHRNPYTGMTWGQDPALIGICPVNEDSILPILGKYPDIYNIYKQRFEQERRKAGLDENDLGAFNRFAIERQRSSDQRMKQYIRSLGVQTLITGNNFMNQQAQVLLRQSYDYVDNHIYWDHPKFTEKKWSLPYSFSQANPLRVAAEYPRRLMSSRIFGKPYAITEFHFCWPNQYRAGGGPLMLAYAGLQDWDAMYNFAYSHSISVMDTPSKASTFNMVQDPITLLSDRVSALMFRRGDVLPAQKAIAYMVDPDEACSGSSLSVKSFPSSFSTLGLVMRIGSISATSDVNKHGSRQLEKQNIRALVSDTGSLSDGLNLPEFTAADDIVEKVKQAGILLANQVDADRKHFVSDTGQIELQADKGCLKLVTENSECFVLGANQNLAGHIAQVQNGSSFRGIYVVSVDGNALVQSRRILVLHLTNTLSEGVRFSNNRRTKVESYGSLSYLVAAGQATIYLKLISEPTMSWKAWAVDGSGARQWAIPLERTKDGRFILHAKTVTKQGTTLSYELVCE